MKATNDELTLTLNDARHLPELQRVLWPFYQAIGLKPRGYGQLFWDFIIRNRPPHANWATSTATVSATATAARG